MYLLIDCMVLPEAWIIYDTSSFNIPRYLTHYKIVKFYQNEGVIVVKTNI